MTLIDASAGVEFPKRTGSDTHRSVRALLEQDAEVRTTDVVVMGVLAAPGTPVTARACAGSSRDVTPCRFEVGLVARRQVPERRDRR